jgi:N-acetylmuramoyl-L-alanine amidase
VKKITLAVVLKVGKLLEANPKVDVIYKRQMFFVDLVERANIANRANIFSFPFIVTLIEILLQTVPKPM